MINISELNSFPAQDGGSLAMLKEIAQRYCPEELQAERKAILPDEQLNLSASWKLDSDSFWLEAVATANFLTSEIQMLRRRPFLMRTASASASPRRRSCATCTTRRRTR